jgi:hypothetical protein
MAANKSTVSAADLKNLKDFNKEASSLTTVLRELADALGKNAKEAARFTGESAAAYETSFSNAVNSAKELAGYTAKQLADTKKEAEFNKAVLKTEQDRARVQAKISELKDKQMHASAAEQPYIEKALKTLEDVDDAIESQLKHADGLKKKYEEISKIDVFAPFKEMMGRIPYLNKALPAMGDASKALRDTWTSGDKSIVGGIKAASAGAGKLVNGLGQAAMGAVLGAAVDEFTKLNERSVSMQHNLGVSRLEALKMNDAMIDASQASGRLWFNSERFQEAQEDINKTLGSNGAISADMAENYAQLHHQMGLSTEEATQFSLTSMNMGKNAKDYTASITVQTKLLNGQKKLQIDNREILKGVANTSSRVQLSFKASGQNLAQAVYQAKSLGMNMAQVEKTADSLLDFEASIGNELEAELLSGKEYNLEKARTAALTNDMVGLTSELAKQGITAAAFGKMNRLEQESTAKMLGMSADELGNSLTLQEQLKTVSKESGYRDAQSLEDLQKQVTMRARMKDSKGKEIGMDKALAEIGDKKLRNQVDANTLAERMQLEQKKAAEAVAKAVGPEGLQKTMDTLDSSIKALTVAIAALAGLQLVSTFRSVAKDIRSMKLGGTGGNIASEAGQAAGKSTSSSAAKSASSSATKAASSVGKSAAEAGGGGMFSGLKSFASKAWGGIKSGASKVGGAIKGGAEYVAEKSGGKAIIGWLGKNIGGLVPKFLKGTGGSLLKKIPYVGALIEALSAGMSISDLAAQKNLSKDQLYSETGKTLIGSGMGVLGGSLAATLISAPAALGIPSWLMAPLAYTGGDMLGRWIGGAVSDYIGGPSLGKMVIDTFAGGGKAPKASAPAGEKKMATGGIVTGATRAVVGEAGPEAVIPLREFYAKIDELIGAVKQGGNIHIGANKLNEAIGLNLHPMR